MSILEHVVAIWYYSAIVMVLVLNSDMAWHNPKRTWTACYAIHIGVTYVAITWYGPIMRALRW